MPKALTQLYSLSEIAQIIGTDEKKIHHYAHKGLINPELSNDSTARFTEVDCARLKIIKRADELGYEPDSIFDLIGKPDEVLNAADPVSACEQFAMERYKQIYDELNHCEILEQINKKCDLKLLITYIKHLKALQKKGSSDDRPEEVTPPGKPRPTGRGAQTSSGAPRQVSKPSPHIQHYSVEKLWDYINKAEQQGKGVSPGLQPHGTEPQSQPPHHVEGDRAFFKKPLKQGLSLLTSAQRHLNAQFWTPRTVHLRKKNIEQVWKVWLTASLLIAILSVAGYLLLSNDTGQGIQTPVTAPSSNAQTTAEDNAPSRESITESAPTLGAAEDRPTRDTIQPPEQQPTGQPPEAGAQYGRASIKDAADDAASNSSVPPEQRQASLTDQQSVPAAAAVMQPIESVPSSGVQLTDSKVPAPVQVKAVSIWHDALNNYYRADFTILNNSPATDEEPIVGYVFVHLQTADPASDHDGLLLPSGELHSGKPSQIRQGARFSIRHLKEMRIAAVSTLSPSEITSGSVMVFSPEGDLLLEQPFNVAVQPFFSTAKELPVNPDGKSATPSALTDAAFAKLQSQRTVAPGPQAPDKHVQSTTQPTDEPETLPPAETTAGSGGQAQSSGEKVPPIAKILKTNNPEAAIWEQKSYDAAVQGDLSRAIADATKAIELDPGRVNSYINRAWAYIEKNMLDQAIKDSETALSIDPQNAIAYNNRGLAHQRKAQTQKARDDYRNACELGLELGCQNRDTLINQSRIAELINQSQTAFKNKDWDGVVRVATEVINLDPQNAVAYTNRSVAYAKKSYLNKALKDSNEAIKHNPDFSLAYNNRGFVFELLGSNRKAAADYLKSCSLGLDLGCKNFERLNGTQ
jgi:DNA-binding transcriptional MerR regulator/Flp pilus assembly protein TadD